MAALLQQPGYTDAYYYYNAAQRAAQGHGLTDVGVWTYFGAPGGLPIPSHLYWMPLPSLLAVPTLLLSPTFDAAQIPFVLLYAALAVIAFWLGARLSGSRRSGWLAGLLMMFSGYFMPYWTTTATFAPFGVVAALALIAMGIGRQGGQLRWFAVSGACSGLAHLTRADGVLLLPILALAALLSGMSLRRGVTAVVVGVAAYALVMTPWALRNLSAIGVPLPVGGLQTAWMRSYDEIVNYPPVIDARAFVAWGAANIIRSRLDALVINVQRFVVEQGLIVFAPLMLIGLWQRRRDPLLTGFAWYALALHAVMTLVFTFPGTRGGLFHSAAALMPFWTALGVCGLDDVIAWAARRRRWRVAQAKAIFSTAALGWAVVLSALAFFGRLPAWNAAGDVYRELPPWRDQVVMINDPAAWVYFKGGRAVVLPNSSPEAIPDLATRYGVAYVILDMNRTAPMNDLWERRNVPFFLKSIYRSERFRVYEVRID
jgi:4-amino-4-deoxy-L-arabinose transferase-like glycosyltransferase